MDESTPPQEHQQHSDPPETPVVMPVVTPVVMPVVTPVLSEATPKTTVPFKEPSSKKKSHLWLYLIIVVVIIVVGLGIWYAVAHKSNTSTATTKKDIPLITYGFHNNPLNVFYPNPAVVGGMWMMNEQIFEGLVGFKDGAKIVSDLASGWTNPNTTTWIFTLKPNVYYHDGDKVTAQDVVYSWQQVNAQSPQLASFTTSTISNVKAVNNTTVEITTTAPDPVLLNRLTNLWVIDSKAPKGTQPWELGTGAYTVKTGTTPSANNIDLVAFNKWHGGHIYTRAIDYVFYSDPTKAVTALIAGKVDLVDAITPSNIAQIKKDSNLAVITQPPVVVNYIGFNTLTANSPIANPKIREAIDLTVNPTAVLNVLGPDSGTAIDQVVPPDIPGYNLAITRPAINLTLAKQLVSEAGYPNGVTINLGDSPPGAVVGQEIAKELAPIGITVKLDIATDEGTYFNDISNGTYQAFYEAYGSSIADGSDILAYWQNAPFYNNPTFDAQVTKANQTFNPTQRLADLEQASQTLVNDNAIIPLFLNSFYSASKKGFVFPLGAYDTDINTFFSSVYQQ
jgi:peptide/nickel transport system substrate-binding protein